MGGEFDAATEIVEGRLDLDSRWIVGGGVNGGLLLAVLGSAGRRALPDKPDPFALSAHYVTPSTTGPAEVSTRVVRDGGSTATVAIDLSQAGQQRITALATYGDLAALPPDVATTATPPDARRPAGWRSPSGRATWPAGCSRRTARSGTPPAGWSRRAGSSRGCRADGTRSRPRPDGS